MNTVSKALPIMVNSYARLFGVSVRIQGSVAYTNGKVITIPRLDVNDPTKARLAYGYLAHESAHIRYTDFKILEKPEIKQNLLIFSLFNILEDNRIETLISKEFIGVYENLELLNAYYESDWQKFCASLFSINVINVVLAFIQCYSQCKCQKFSCSRKRAALLYFHLRTRISSLYLLKIARIVQKCASAKSSLEVYASCLEIFDILNSGDFEFKDDRREKIGDRFERNDALRSEFERFNLRPAYGMQSSKERFKQEFVRFKVYSNNSVDDVTPSKNAAAIIEENSNEAQSSTRDDFGVIAEHECREGSLDFIHKLDDTYGIRNSLQHKVRSYVDILGSSCPYGRVIDPMKVQKICVGEMSIYKSRVRQDEFNTAVHVLVDASSSMLSSDGGEFTRCEESCRVALMLALALEGIDGIKSMVTFFPGIDSEYEVALRSNERASRVSARFDQRPRGSTPLAQAMWYACDKFGELGCNRNIMLVITDGMPDSVTNVKNCIDYARENQIEIYGISIRSDAILKLFDKAQVIESAKDLREKAFSLFSGLFSINKTDYS